MNPNAISNMWNTFDHADFGAMCTNQAMEMTQAGDTNKPHTSLQNATVYPSTGFPCTWWKVKSNITCARRYGKLQPMRLDIPRATILQWSNKEWLGRALLSWINIRGQTDLVNTQLLTFIEMHWMVVCIKQWIPRWNLHTTDSIRWKGNHATSVKLQSLLQRVEKKSSVFWVNRGTEHQAALKHPWYCFHVLCMYMFNLIAETD